MKPERKSMIKQLLTATLFIVAVALAQQSFTRLAFYERQVKARMEEQAFLEKMEEQLENQRAAFDFIAGQAGGDDSVSNLMKRHLSGAKSDLIVREKKSAGRGWMIHVMDLRIDPISPEKLSTFLVACENAKPPIRLVDIQVSASSAGRRALIAQLALAELNPPALLSAP